MDRNQHLDNNEQQQTHTNANSLDTDQRAKDQGQHQMFVNAESSDTDQYMNKEGPQHPTWDNPYPPGDFQRALNSHMTYNDCK